MLQAEFCIVLTQVRSYVFLIQYSVSHRIGNPVQIYDRTDHFFHAKFFSHNVLVNTIRLHLLYSHTGLLNVLFLQGLIKKNRPQCNCVIFGCKKQKSFFCPVWFACYVCYIFRYFATLENELRSGGRNTRILCRHARISLPICNQ